MHDIHKKNEFQRSLGLISIYIIHKSLSVLTTIMFLGRRLCKDVLFFFYVFS